MVIYLSNDLRFSGYLANATDLFQTKFYEHWLNTFWVIKKCVQEIFRTYRKWPIMYSLLWNYRLCTNCYGLFAHVISLRLTNSFLSNKHLTICNENCSDIPEEVIHVSTDLKLTGYLSRTFCKPNSWRLVNNFLSF